MVQDLVQLLTAAEALDLCGLDAALSQPRHDGDAEGWLQGLLENVAGKRSYDSVITYLFENAQESAALTLAARAHERRHLVSASVLASLEAVWLSWTREYEEDKAIIERVLAHTSENAAGFDDDRRQALADLEALPILGARPSRVNVVQEAVVARKYARSLRGDVEALADVVAFDTKDKYARLLSTAQQALAAAIKRLEASETPSEIDEALLRAIPELILRRQPELLERIAKGSDVDIPLGALGALQTRAPPPGVYLPTINARASQSASAPQLAAISQTLISQAPNGRQPLSSNEDIQRFDQVLGLGVSHGEAGDFWLGVAKITSVRGLYLAAIGHGLLAWGREYLQLERLRFAGEVLRDAAACLAAISPGSADASLEECIHALVVAKIWPTYLSDASPRTARLRLAEWIATPETVYAWVVKTHNVHLLAAAWVELINDSAAERFLEITSLRTGLGEELLRECATGLVNAFQLRTRPRQTLDRLRRLFEPHAPAASLVDALDDVAQHLEDTHRGSSITGPNRGLPRRVDEIRDGIEDLRGKVSLFDDVADRLPGLLNSLLHSRQTLAEPKVTVQPLIGTFYPVERSREVTIPILVRNAADAAPASDVAVQLSLVSEKESHSLVSMELDQAERPVGALEPGSEHQVVFTADLDSKLVLQVTQLRFRVQVRSGINTLADSGFTVNVRPGDRSERPNPYPTGKRVTPGQFIGREVEIRQIVDSVLGVKQDRTPIVIGIRRIGKTSLLYKVEADPDIGRRFYCSQIDLEDRPRTETTESFLIYLTERILDCLPESFRVRLPFSRQAFREEPYGAFERFGDALNALPLQRQVLLIIDEIDKLLAIIKAGEEPHSSVPLGPNQVLQPEVLGALRKTLMKDGAVRMVFAGLPTFLEGGYTDRLFGLFLPIHLKPFTEEEANRVLKESGGVLDLTRRAREYLFRATGLQPYLLNLVCYFLFAAAATSGRDLITLADVEEAIEDKLLSSESYFTDYMSLAGAAAPILRAVAAAERGAQTRRYVSVTEIRRELLRGGETIDFTALLRTLEELCQRDRPLLMRAPNAVDRFQTVIGMLGEHLLRRAAS